MRGISVDARYVLGFATLVAVVATVGSLYLSLGLSLIPCTLCWYQRILMYPLVVIMGTALYERRSEVYRTVMPLSLLGGFIAAYHSYLQVNPPETSTCTIVSDIGCAAVQYRVLGLTIPNLSLIAFVLISLSMVVLVYSERLKEVD
ncbi:MAG: disulfide bond formation protein B [Halobacteria archaeon]|nr:disulfide bond formation protein B [Halobacteria archaeon]